MIWAYIALIAVGLGSLVSLVSWIIQEVRKADRVDALSSQVIVDASVNKAKDAFIKTADAAAARSMDYDEKINKEFGAGPSADNLNKLFNDSDSVPNGPASDTPTNS